MEVASVDPIVKERSELLERTALRACAHLLVPSSCPPTILLRSLHSFLACVGVMTAKGSGKDFEVEEMIVREMSRMLMRPSREDLPALPERLRRHSSPRRVTAFEPSGDEEVSVIDICKVLALALLDVEGKMVEDFANEATNEPRERLIAALKLLMGTPTALERMKTIELTYGGVEEHEAPLSDSTTSPVVGRSRRRRTVRSSASSSSPSTIALTSSPLPGGTDASSMKRYTSPTRRKAGGRKRIISSFRARGDGSDDSSSSDTGAMRYYEKLDEEDGSPDDSQALLQPPAAPQFDQRAPRRFLPSGQSTAGDGRALSASPRMNWKLNSRKVGASQKADEPNRNSIAEEISTVSFGGSDCLGYSTIPEQRMSRPSRHVMLYQRGMQMREDRLRKVERVQEERKMEELASCTFKPRTRGSSSSGAPSSSYKEDTDASNPEKKSANPRGYSQAVSRLQRGYRERQLVREVVENRDPDGTAMQQLLRNQKAGDTSNSEFTPGSRKSTTWLPHGGAPLGRRTGRRGVRRAPPDGDAPATSISPPTTERNKKNLRTSDHMIRPSSNRTPNSGRLSVKRESPYARLPSISKRNSHSKGRGRSARTDAEWIEVEVTRNTETGGDRRYVVGKLLIQEGQPPRAIHEAVMAFSQKHRLKASEIVELHKVLKHKLDTKDYDDIPAESDKLQECPISSPCLENSTPPHVNAGVDPNGKPPFSSPRPSHLHSPSASIESPTEAAAIPGNAASAPNDCELSFGSSSSLEENLHRFDQSSLEGAANPQGTSSA